MEQDPKSDKATDVLIDQGEPEVYIDIAGVEHSRPVSKEPSARPQTEEIAPEAFDDLPEELKPSPTE